MLLCMATRELLNIISAIDSFRLVAGNNPPLQLLQCFLYVASVGKCKQQVLQEVTGLSEASCCRMLKWLGPTKHDGTPGLSLIRTEADPQYWKRNVLYLTKKGEQLASLLEKNLNE